MLETYTEDNLQTVIISRMLNDATEFSNFRKEMSYYEGESLSLFKDFYWHDNEWVLRNYTTYAYIEDGLLINMTRHSWSIDLNDYYIKSVVEYAYNENNQLAQRDYISFNENDPNSPSMYVRNEYIYDEYTPNEESELEIKPNLMLTNYPNPFNPETTIAFNLEKDSKVSIEIYNILGQKIKTIAHDSYQAGNNTVVWNGTDNNGNSVASGIYFYKVKAGGNFQIKKCILMK